MAKMFKEDFTTIANAKEPLPFIPTGSMILDFLIGGRKNMYGFAPCPGLPCGKLSRIYGDPSTGKTTIALQISAEVCKRGGQVLYIDWEHELAPVYAHTIGVPVDDPDRFMIYSPDTLEQGIGAIWKAASMGINFIVVDSIGAGMPEALEKQTVEQIGEEVRMGLISSLWSKYLPKIKKTVKKSGTALLGIAQLRANVGARAFQKQHIVQGGNAWGYYSALQIYLQKSSSEKEKLLNEATRKTEDAVIGTKIRAVLEKNKVSDSFLQSKDLYIRWGEGIDNLTSIIQIAIAYGLIKKAGAWYSLELPDGSVTRLNGTSAVRSYLKGNPKISQILEIQVMQAMQGSDPMAPSVEDDSDAETGFDLNQMVGG